MTIGKLQIDFATVTLQAISPGPQKLSYVELKNSLSWGRYAPANVSLRLPKQRLRMSKSNECGRYRSANVLLFQGERPSRSDFGSSVRHGAYEEIVF